MTPETLVWIEEQKPQLVALAEDYVERTKLFEATEKTKNKPTGERTPKVKTNQLRNLLNAAQAGHPLALLTNFLRYQLGRRSNAWKHELSGNALLKDFAEKLSPLCDERLKGESRERYEMEAHIAAQFLGFIIREYTYQCALKGTRP